MNEKLLNLLRSNARENISELSRHLNLSRTAVQARIKKLESTGYIDGYTIRESDQSLRDRITAHVMIEVQPKLSARIVKHLEQIDTVFSIYAISGIYDLIAVLKASDTIRIDNSLDKIGAIDGVEKTQSSIILSTKLER